MHTQYLSTLLRISLLVSFALTFLTPAISYAAADTTPIGAKAVYVEDGAFVTKTNDPKRIKLRIGASLQAGDLIETTTGVVEVVFDNGSLIRINRKSQLRIQTLYRKPSGATTSIFGLIVGSVKSAVKKLHSSDSVFEYRTRAAVAGVSGTPPFVVQFNPANNQMNVDLLGKKGQAGSVFMRGFDAKKTLINILPGQGSSTRFGKSPLMPSPIPPARFRQLTRGMPFVSKPALNEAAVGKTTVEQVITNDDKDDDTEKDQDDSDKPDKDKDKDKDKEQEKDTEPASDSTDDDKTEEPDSSDDPDKTSGDADKEPESKSGDSTTSADGGATDATGTGSTGDPPADPATDAKSQLSTKIGSSGASIATSVTRDAAFQTVSTTIKPSPEAASSIQSTSSQTSTVQGTVGEAVGGSTDLPPVAARSRFEVRFR